MKGYYLRIKKTVQYKAMHDEKREHNFIKAKRERLTIDFEDRIKKLHKWHMRYCARYYEKANALREHRLCRYIRGERNYYG